MMIHSMARVAVWFCFLTPGNLANISLYSVGVFTKAVKNSDWFVGGADDEEINCKDEASRTCFPATSTSRLNVLRKSAPSKG